MGQNEVQNEWRPNICGNEQDIKSAREASQDWRLYPGEFEGNVQCAFGNALHFHQPNIFRSDSAEGLPNASVVSNLVWMSEGHGNDSYNAGPFEWCYKRLGEFIPALAHEGKRPRIMVEYSGTLLECIERLGNDRMLGALRGLACNPEFNENVEWLGAPWGHAVAPSTPVQDYRLHVMAWQAHFAAMFGLDALKRVRGFSPSEMALPNQPDVAFNFVKTLKECGYRWVLIQESTVEELDGGEYRPDDFPVLLKCRSSGGEEASIVGIIKKQGSDTKLVAQGQPYYEAKCHGRAQLAGRLVPRFVAQIADGENGGVMMNEFPGKFHDIARESAGSPTRAMNGTEYLEKLFATGIQESDLRVVQPRWQHRIWDKYQCGSGPERLKEVIAQARQADHRFSMEGGSWTNNLSWERGYEDLLDELQKVSAEFYRKVLAAGIPTNEYRYQNALWHLMQAQTSCFRYWGVGIWTDYAKEFVRRLWAILQYDF